MTALERQLLSRIAKLPAGEKLPLARFARELNASQSLVGDAVQALLDEGRLDEKTLRLPAADRGDCAGAPCQGADEEAGAASAQPSGAAPAQTAGDRLFKRIVAEAKRRGIGNQAAGREIFGGPTRIYELRRMDPVRPIWAEKVERWLASPAAALVPSGTLTGGELLAEIDAACERVAGLTRQRVARMLSWSTTTIECLAGSRVKPATVTRVRGVLAAAEAQAERREHVEDRRLATETAHAIRRPGETVADAARRASIEQPVDLARICASHPKARKYDPLPALIWAKLRRLAEERGEQPMALLPVVVEEGIAALRAS